jgi:hypothetical protein
MRARKILVVATCVGLGALGCKPDAGPTPAEPAAVQTTAAALPAVNAPATPAAPAQVLRPLLDADGRPAPGNVMTKSGPVDAARDR